MLKEKKNSRKQGDVGLGDSIAYFTAMGWTVCVPLTDNQEYDLVVDNGDGIKTVQVKTTYCKTRYGVYKVNLRVFGGNQSRQSITLFDSSKVDYVYALTEDGDRYLIPSEKITNVNSLNLGKDMQQFKV
jgi:hypothetical protein